jgi:hypothetical protein
MRKGYRELYDKYSEAVELLQAYIPKLASNPLKLQVLKERVKLGEAALSEAGDYLVRCDHIISSTRDVSCGMT